MARVAEYIWRDGRQAIEFPTNEEDAVKFLQQHGIIPREVKCVCGHPMVLHTGAQTLWGCTGSTCPRVNIVRFGGSILTSQVTFLKVVHFLHEWSLDPTSASTAADHLGIREKVVLDWSSYLREVCVSSLCNLGEHRKIGGNGLLVEVDESVYRKMKYKSEGTLSLQWLVGGICRETNQSFLVRVNEHSAASLMAAILDNVEKGSAVCLASGHGYSKKDLSDAGYDRLVDSQGYVFVDTTDPKDKKWLEEQQDRSPSKLWGFTRWRRECHEHSPKRLTESFLAEFFWRCSMLDDSKPFESIFRELRKFSPPEHLPNSVEEAAEFLQKRRLLSRSRLCQCGGYMTLRVLGKLIWECDKGCRIRLNATLGNCFDDKRMSLPTAIRFIYAWSLEQTSVEYCMLKLKMAKQTVFDWNFFLREVCVNAICSVPRKGKKIGGEGLVVEIDEAKFASFENSVPVRNSGTSYRSLIGGFCRERNEVFLVRGGIRNAKLFLTTIEDNVAPGSLIYLDPWLGYSRKALRRFGYEELKTKYTFLDEPPLEESKIWGASRWRKEKFVSTVQHFTESYLAEFMWRKSLSFRRDPFEAILQDLQKMTSKGVGWVAEQELERQIRARAYGCNPDLVNPLTDVVADSDEDEPISVDDCVKHPQKASATRNVARAVKFRAFMTGEGTTAAGPESSMDGKEKIVCEIRDPQDDTEMKIRMGRLENAERENAKKEAYFESVFDESVASIAPYIQPSSTAVSCFYCAICNLHQPLGNVGAEAVYHHVESQWHQKHLWNSVKEKVQKQQSSPLPSTSSSPCQTAKILSPKHEYPVDVKSEMDAMLVSPSTSEPVLSSATDYAPPLKKPTAASPSEATRKEPSTYQKLAKKSEPTAMEIESRPKQRKSRVIDTDPKAIETESRATETVLKSIKTEPLLIETDPPRVIETALKSIKTEPKLTETDPPRSIESEPELVLLELAPSREVPPEHRVVTNVNVDDAGDCVIVDVISKHPSQSVPRKPRNSSTSRLGTSGESSVITSSEPSTSSVKRSRKQFFFAYLSEEPSTSSGVTSERPPKWPVALDSSYDKILFPELQFPFKDLARRLPIDRDSECSNEWAASFLRKLELLNLHPQCRCSRLMALSSYKETGKTMWMCRRPHCGQRKMVTVGRFDVDINTSLAALLRFIRCWAREPMSAYRKAAKINVFCAVAEEWKYNLRELCAIALTTQQACSKRKIGGKGLLVEIDVSVSGLHIPTVKQWLIGGLCRKTGETFLVRSVSRMGGAVLKAIIEKVAPHSVIYLDPWLGYKYTAICSTGYAQALEGLDYSFLDPSAEEFDTRVRENHLWGSSLWREDEYRDTEHHFAESYLAEFMWHCSAKDPFVEILQELQQDMAQCRFKDIPPTSSRKAREEKAPPAAGSSTAKVAGKRANTDGMTTETDATSAPVLRIEKGTDKGPQTGQSDVLRTEEDMDEGPQAGPSDVLRTENATDEDLQAEKSTDKVCESSQTNSNAVGAVGLRTQSRTVRKTRDGAAVRVLRKRPADPSKTAQQIQNIADEEDQLAMAATAYVSTADDAFESFIQPSRLGTNYLFCIVCSVHLPRSDANTIAEHVHSRRHIQRQAEALELEDRFEVYTTAPPTNPSYQEMPSDRNHPFLFGNRMGKEAAKQRASPPLPTKQIASDPPETGAESAPMECQVEKDVHFRHMLLFEFNRGTSATDAARNICAVYGSDSVNARTAQSWFARFRKGNFDLKDGAPGSGTPSDFDETTVGDDDLDSEAFDCLIEEMMDSDEEEQNSAAATRVKEEARPNLMPEHPITSNNDCTDMAKSSFSQMRSNFTVKEEEGV